MTLGVGPSCLAVGSAWLDNGERVVGTLKVAILRGVSGSALPIRVSAAVWLARIFRDWEADSALPHSYGGVIRCNSVSQACGVTVHPCRRPCRGGETIQRSKVDGKDRRDY